MATPLRKPVHRETVATVRDGSKLRQIIASLLPGDVLSLRPKGTRRPEVIALSTVWAYAVKLRVMAERAEKQAKRAAKRVSYL